MISDCSEHVTVYDRCRGGKIYVPSGSYSKYNNTTPYKNYTIIEE